METNEEARIVLSGFNCSKRTLLVIKSWVGDRGEFISYTIGRNVYVSGEFKPTESYEYANGCVAEVMNPNVLE